MSVLHGRLAREPAGASDRLPRWIIPVWIAIVGSLVAFAGWLVVPRDGSVLIVPDIVLLNLVYLLAAVLCWSGGRHPPGELLAWRLLAVSLILIMAGNVSLVVSYSATHPSWSDTFYLAHYGFLDVAIIQLLRSRSRRFAAALWLDGLVVGLGGGSVVAAFVVAPLLSIAPGGIGEVLTNLAYPVLDLTLLVLLCAAASLLGLRMGRRLGWLAVGIGLTFCVNIAYLTVTVDGGGYTPGGPIDLGWMLGTISMAWAATIRPTSEGAPEEPPRAQLRTVALPALAKLAALIVLLAGFSGGLPPLAGILAGSCIVLAVLRTALTLRELRALPEARREARTDPLTGLANRRHVDERCSDLLAAPAAPELSILIMDLNGFKKINDTYGHHAGDQLLIEVARRMAAVMRRDDLLGRLGGDEFAAVLPRTDPEQALAVAHRMQQALAEPVVVDGVSHRVRGSIGVSSSRLAHASTATVLFRSADVAMYQAKTGDLAIAVAPSSNASLARPG